MNLDEIITIQNNLEIMRNHNSSDKLIYVIILGIVNHWSVLILEKHCGNIKSYYLDSYNTFNFYNLEKENNIDEYVDKIVKYNKLIFYFIINSY
jgi:hypothetical protein